MQRNFRHTKDVLRYSAVYKKRRKVKTVKMVVFGILFICILGGVISIVRLPTFTISEIQVKGLQSASTQDVINEIDTKIGGNYALVLPKKNIFFYPKDKIKSDLLNKFSTFADVSIRTIDTNKLEITVVEKNAIAVSCKTEGAIIDKSFIDCFFIDHNAKAFQSIVGEPDQSLPRYVDLNVNTTSTMLSLNAMDQVKKVSDYLSGKNLVTEFIKIADLKGVEFKIINNGKIKISIPFNDDFMSVLDTALNTKLLAGNAKFEYIDARFGNKVFFKAEGVGVLSDKKATTSTSTPVLITKIKNASTTKSTSTSTVKATTTSRVLIKKR
jgi:cell division septal protein FtsQ